MSVVTFSTIKIKREEKNWKNKHLCMKRKFRSLYRSHTWGWWWWWRFGQDKSASYKTWIIRIWVCICRLTLLSNRFDIFHICLFEHLLFFLKKNLSQFVDQIWFISSVLHCVRVYRKSIEFKSWFWNEI